MNHTLLKVTGFALAVILAFGAGAFVAGNQNPQKSAIIAKKQASMQESDWGTMYTYYEGESYGTKDGLTAVADIKPGQQIHPPHVHAEEEYLMVIEGEGTWHLNGEEQPAAAGDILYAAPWDVHGITNTGTDTLSFVVWKWNSKGVEIPTKPE